MSSAPSSFEYHAKPCRVLFGSGSIQKLPEEVKRLGKVKPLLLSGPRQSDRMKPLEAVLEHASITPAGTFANATMHTPIHVTEEALKYAIDTGADILVSFGGGSAIGLGKALSVRTGLKHICVPTTYAGSEMTSVLGETVDKKKTTRSDDKILPYAVIYVSRPLLSTPLFLCSLQSCVHSSSKPLHSRHPRFGERYAHTPVSGCRLHHDSLACHECD